jgi:cytochrome P450
MLTLTQELFGAADPELSRGTSMEDLLAVVQDFFVYFTELTEARKADPTGDLASVIANATIDGEPVGIMEQISYYVIVATAGHDTTASAMAGGMQALIENPDQLARLQSDPSLVGSAVDEIIRWTTPVKHFMRNCTTEYTLRGHTFKPGDAVLLSYPSANRDEEVFDDPHRFDVGRTPNDHLAFGGGGVHYCLGASLARAEIRATMRQLVERLPDLELVGEPSRLHSDFVNGIKTMPVRFTPTAAAGKD